MQTTFMNWMRVMNSEQEQKDFLLSNGWEQNPDYHLFKLKNGQMWMRLSAAMKKQRRRKKYNSDLFKELAKTHAYSAAEIQRAGENLSPLVPSMERMKRLLHTAGVCNIPPERLAKIITHVALTVIGKEL